MKKLIILLLYSLLAMRAQSQWSIFVGGGANMTTDCRKGANLGHTVNLTPPYQREWYITKGFGGGGGIGCSYLLKKHHLFLLKLTYNNQVINGKFGNALSNEDPHSPNFGSFGSYYIQYEPLQLKIQSMFIPIFYGYSLFGNANFFTLTPFIGWGNRFEFDGYYSGSIIAGFRMRIKCFYLDCFYGRMLTKFNIEFSTIRLQTVNLSIGYVYTFKTKAERQNKKE